MKDITNRKCWIRTRNAIYSLVTVVAQSFNHIEVEYLRRKRGVDKMVTDRVMFHEIIKIRLYQEC